MQYHSKELQSTADDRWFEHPQRFSSARSPLSRFPIPAFSVAILLCANSVLAGSYEIIQGKGVEVCEAYAKNLNSFNPSEPMLCERPVNSKFNDFSKPNWEKLTADQIAEINVDTIDRMLSMATPNSEVLKQPKSERIRKAKELAASAHNDSWPLSVVRGSADLDNDGKLESYVKDIHGNCDKRNPLPSAVLRPIGADAINTRLLEFLKNAQERKVDVRNKCESKTDILPTKKTNDIRGELTREQCKMATMEGVTLKEPLGGSMYPDVFRYKNEWYLDMWTTERGPSYVNGERLHVFQYKNGNAAELCAFNFRGNTL